MNNLKASKKENTYIATFFDEEEALKRIRFGSPLCEEGGQYNNGVKPPWHHSRIKTNIDWSFTKADKRALEKELAMKRANIKKIKQRWKFYDFRIKNRWKSKRVRDSMWIPIGLSIKDAAVLEAKYIGVHLFGVDFLFSFHKRASNINDK